MNSIVPSDTIPQFLGSGTSHSCHLTPCSFAWPSRPLLILCSAVDKGSDLASPQYKICMLQSRIGQKLACPMKQRSCRVRSLKMASTTKKLPIPT